MTGRPHTQTDPRFAALFEAHGAFTWRLLRYLGVPEPDLEDAVQDVFLVVHRKLDSLRPEASARSWIGGIASRVAANRRRRGARRLAREEPMAEPPEAVSEPRALAALEEAQARQRLLETLDSLSDVQREVFVMHVIEQIPVKEVAAALGCALQTAYYRLDRARSELRAAIDRMMEEP